MTVGRSKSRELEVTRGDPTLKEHERQLATRPDSSQSFTSTFNIDPADIPEGMHYCAIRKGVNGKPDMRNIQTALRQGYKPVPASRHPELILPDSISLIADVNKEILESGDLILMEIPIEKLKELTTRSDWLANEQTKSVEWATKEGFHESMPRQNSFRGYSTSSDFQSIGK